MTKTYPECPGTLTNNTNLVNVSVCVLLCHNNLCCASHFCTNGGGVVGSRSTQMSMSHEANASSGAQSQVLNEAGRHQQHPGPGNEDSRHKLNQPSLWMLGGVGSLVHHRQHNRSQTLRSPEFLQKELSLVCRFRVFPIAVRSPYKNSETLHKHSTRSHSKSFCDHDQDRATSIARSGALRGVGVRNRR